MHSPDDRPRCVFWLDYRHYSRWQANDEASLRLEAQARIWTPCATWLRQDGTLVSDDDDTASAEPETPGAKTESLA